MINIEEFINKLKNEDIYLSSIDNELGIKSKGGEIPIDLLSIIKENKEDILTFLNKRKYPLSFAQERLWFIDQYEHNASYNIPAAIKLIGKLDINVLEKTFSEIIRRHEVLRTNIVTINNVACQLIHKESKCELKIVDQSHLSGEQANQEIKVLIEIESQKPFDLANDSLIRLVLYKINDQEHTLFLNQHHIISDGWSFSVIFKEISILYKAFSENKPSPLPELEIQYADYAVWQREHIEGDLLTKQSEYWKNKLSGIGILELPTDKPRPKEQTFIGTNLHFNLGKGISEKLNTISKENDATLFMTLLSAFNVLINKYTGQDDICVGTAIANRTRSEIEPLIGFFANTLALRSDLSEDINFVDLVKQVKQTTLDAYGNQDIPFEKVVDIAQPERNLSYSPLFQVGMALHNTPVGELSFGDLRLCPIDFESNVSKIDLTINFTETAEGLAGGIEYNTDLFDKVRIERMIGHLNVLVESIISNPKANISDLEILTPAERHKLLIEWNNTKVDYPKDKCIHQLFEEQVEKTPNNVAVVFENTQLTYTELNEKANQLGHYLQSKGVKPDSLVGVCVDRSLEMVVGLLGILKAGGVYVPIDPSYPEERISYMLEDSGAMNVITSSKTLDTLSINSLLSHSNKRQEPILTPKCEQIKNLNILPHPDRFLIDYSRYHQRIGVGLAKHTVSIQATRGCPYKCAYCHKIWPKTHFFRDPDNIFNEIINCYNAGVSRIIFIDDIFNLNKENSRSVLNKIISSGIDIQLSFPNGLRGDILTKDFIDLMVQAGTVNITLALESASPRIQKLIGKNLNIDKLKDNINYIANNYPHVILELEMMVGFPTETMEEATMTLDFIKDIKWLHYPNLNVLKIYPNTDMYKLAIENGVTENQITSSIDLAYHELPNTLPYSKSFVRQLQADFMNYFLSKERLNHILTNQFKNFTVSEILQKFELYLSGNIKTLNDLLELADIDNESFKQINFLPEDYRAAPDFNSKIKKYFPETPKNPDAYRILLIDMSLLFSTDSDKTQMNLFEEPLGLMYLLSYLNQEFKEKISGKILKSNINFNSYSELKDIISDFKPNLIGIRTLSYYKNFFHEAVSKMKHWFPHIPIISGGPYATSDYKFMLQDSNVDIAVIGEGELALVELIRKIMENKNQIPDYETLKELKSIAFIEKKNESQNLKNIIQIDKLPKVSEGGTVGNVKSNIHANNLSYVIYTSGSTGKPKGVEITHASLLSLAHWHNEKFEVTSNTKATQLANLAFDAATWEIWPYLIKGASLYIVGQKSINDVNELFEDIVANQISHCFVPTPIAELLLQLDWTRVVNLKYLLTGGDYFVGKNLDIKQLNFKIVNNYGPTENTVVTTSFTLDKSLFLPPIGKPINNVSVFILNRYLNIVPVGVAGELYISGDSLARGYRCRPELTAEKFIKNPFSNDPNSRLYKTGDLVKYLPDGNIEFLGRIDNQVKIRGFRIELGEIESALNKTGAIKDCVVVVKEDTNGNKRLVAYVVSDDELKQGIRETLSRSLPDYMIPSLFVRLEKMPLTPNGKIDRKALPEPEGQVETTQEYVAPRNETEQKLADIWAKVLGVEKVGIYDNFFELGGDSIITIQIVSRAKQENMSLTPKDIFKYRTIAELAKVSNINDLKIIAEQNQISGEIALTPIQSWFFEESFENMDHWNQSVVLKVKGSVEIKVIENAINALIKQHDVLRLSYTIEKGKWTQKHNELPGYQLEVVDCSNLSGEELSKSVEEYSSKIQGSLSIKDGVLFKAALFKTDNDNELLLAINHLVVDGVSWRIIIEDLQKACLQQINSKEIDLGMKTSSFKQWAERLAGHANSDKLAKELTFWDGVIGKSNNSLPFDYSGENTGASAKDITVKLNKKLTQQLLKEAGKAYKTEINDLLLTALAISLEKWTKNNDITINLEGHGREDLFIDTDISRTVGWFTTQFPVCLSLGKSNNTADTIKSIKEQLRRIPNKGVGYSVLRYLHPEASVRERLILQKNNEIGFNYLGQFDNLQENSSLISISNQPSGVSIADANHRVNILDINSLISDGELVTSYTYSENLHKKETIENLANSYIVELQKIIEHCLQPESNGYTPSDFPLADINQEELDYILTPTNTNEFVDGEDILL